MDLPLPRAHRKIGPLDLRSAIQTLAGEPWHLHEDAIQRVIWLTLKDEVDLESGVPEDVAAIRSGNTHSSTRSLCTTAASVGGVDA